MGKIRIEDVDKYKVGGSKKYFSLKDDGDFAKVRFLLFYPEFPLRIIKN
jgi:hypothetical protein